MIRPTKIDFNNAHKNQIWLNYFGSSGLDVVCKTDSGICAEGGQDLGCINWGGAVFNQYANPANTDFIQSTASKAFEEMYFARLVIDLRTSHIAGQSEFRSLLGAANDFETAAEDLKEKIEKRIIRAHYDTMFAPKGIQWAGNQTYSEKDLVRKGYRSVVVSDLASNFTCR